MLIQTDEKMITKAIGLWYLSPYTSLNLLRRGKVVREISIQHLPTNEVYIDDFKKLAKLC